MFLTEYLEDSQTYNKSYFFIWMFCELRSILTDGNLIEYVKVFCGIDTKIDDSVPKNEL